MKKIRWGTRVSSAIEREELIDKVRSAPWYNEDKERELQSLLAQQEREEKPLTGMEKRRQDRLDQIARMREEKVFDKAQLESQMMRGGTIKNPEKENIRLIDRVARFEDEDEILNYLRRELPEGREPVIIKQRDGERIPGYFKSDVSDPNFYRLNKPGLSIGDAGLVSAAVANAENILGAGAALATGGKSIARAALVEIVASMTGRTIDEIVENKFFGAENDVMDIISEAGESGATAAVGVGLSGVLEKIYRRSKLALKEGIGNVEVDEFTRSAERIGAPSPSAAEILDTPFANRVNRMVTSLTKEGQKTAKKREMAATEALQNVFNDEVDYGNLVLDEDGRLDYISLKSQLGDKNLLKVKNQMLKEARDLVTRDLAEIKNTNIKPIRSSQAGEALIEKFYGAGGVDDVMRATERSNYDIAKQISMDENAVFNTKILRDEVKQLLVEPRMPGVSNEALSFNAIQDNEVKSILSRLSLLADDTGKPIVSTKDYGLVNQYGEPIKLETKETVTPKEAIESLIQLRSRLYDLSRGDPQTGQHNSSSRAALMAHKKITQVLESSSSKAASNAWRKANNGYRENQIVREAFELGRLKDQGITGRGQQVYEHLIKQGSISDEHIRLFQKHLPKNEFEKFRSAYHFDLLKKPFELTNKLQNLSDAERALIPEEALEIMTLYGNKVSKESKEGISALFSKHSSHNEKVRYVMDDIPADLVDKTLIKLGIPKSIYRANIFEDFLTKTTKLEKGNPVVDRAAFVKELANIKKSKKFDHLNSSQKGILNSLDVFESFNKGMSGDLATSLEAMSILANKADFTNPLTMARAQADITRYSFMGWLSQREAAKRHAQKMVRGKVKHDPVREIRVGTSLLIDVLDDIRRTPTELKDDLP